MTAPQSRSPSQHALSGRWRICWGGYDLTRYHASPDKNLTAYYIYDVNYGELDGLSLLEEAGIAYTSHWDAGDNYSEGERTLRFRKDGTSVVTELYDAEKSLSVFTLMGYINDPDALTEFIRKRYAAVHVLPWTNQVEYGKRYLARKLIQPTGA